MSTFELGPSGIKMRSHITTTYFGNKILEGRIWDVARPWLPHRCMFTGNWILPFTKASRLRMIGHDGKPAMIFLLEYTILWTRSEELIMRKLKGNV